MSKIRVFSGIRPTGKLHLGNYLGAIKNWLDLQYRYSCLFAVVDLHGITTPFQPKNLSKDTLDLIIDLLALGLNPKKCILFIQSHVPQHLELAWILGTMTSIAKLSHLPTYKEKIKLHPDYVNLGLLSYPVLMAADILVYKAELVPVGEDQLPHLEFTREIASKFNLTFGKTFPKPRALLTLGARIMSLTNPNQKMSKTLGSKSYIALSDSPKLIHEKISKAVTDTGPQPGKKMSLGIKNLFTLLELFSSKKTIAYFKKQYQERKIRYSEMKNMLAHDISLALEEFRKRREKLEKRRAYIKKVLDQGAKTARILAQETIKEVKEKIGLI